jgi:hypothetical protein
VTGGQKVNSQHRTDTKPNGPVSAAFLAAGVGSFVLGVMVSIAEALGANAGKYLDFSKNYGIGSGVGPLSGKVVVAVLAFLASWAILHVAFRGKELPFGRVFAATLILVGLGFALTFPPIFAVFAAD